MFKSIFKTIAVVLTAIGVLIRELCGLATDTVEITRDLTGAAKHVSSSFKIRIELFEQQKINAIEVFKHVQDTSDSSDEIQAAYDICMQKIKAVNKMIAELEEAETTEA